MNMILHGIEAPNIVHTNTLTENLSDIQEKRPLRHHPRQSRLSAARSARRVQQNFPIKTGETAFLFLQHFIKRLKAGGRGSGGHQKYFSVELGQRLKEPCARNYWRVATCIPCSTAPVALSWVPA